MDDLISRLAAISAICNACGKIDCDKMNKCEKLQLPPANCSEFPNNSDTISREAVADAINGIECTRHTTWYEFYQKVLTAVEKLPSAEPKRGQWIDDGSELGCQCSQCGKTLDEYINCGTEYMTLTEIPKFCPNCGADMRGEQDG